MIGEVAEISERKDIKGKPMFVVHIITDGVSERYIVPKPHMIDGIEVGDEELIDAARRIEGFILGR